MKKLILCLLVICPGYLFAQIGIKAGLNFANVTGASSINSSSRSGFQAGVFLGGGGKKILGFRNEFTYSKQGYDYKSGTNTGTVNLDYLSSTTLTTISITKYFQIQLGSQNSFLLNAKADTSNSTGTGGSPYGAILKYYNRFDSGLAGGIEIHPVMGLLIGARYTYSLSSLYNGFTSGTNPSFIPKVDAKNNLVNIYAGWRFGKKESKKKKESN